LQNIWTNNKKGVGDGYMYKIIKTIEISASHKLKLDYDSKCKDLHGHNWIITIYCKSKELNSNGMVIDFSEIKKLVTEKLDHKNLNEVLNFNPTAENIAKWIVEIIPKCYKVDVKESLGNVASYEI
jgi:6-pyruvoyltetrahydropterin/6-carboxytetrahydropterin synthase